MSTTAAFDTEPLSGVPRFGVGAGVRAVLVWDDGARHAVYGATVFGRDPHRELGSDAVVLRDETLTLSRTHFAVVPRPGGGVDVVDHGATNGIVIRRGDLVVPVVAGESTPVRAGDRLELGDRWAAIEVAR